MKNMFTSIAAALGLALGTSGVAVAASTTATTDVHALATSEARVLTMLDKYNDSPTWKAQYKAAMARQANDIARVNADLFPAVKQVPLTWTTTGDMQTPSFTVRGTFTLSWDITAPQGGLCSLANTEFDFFPPGSDVISGNYTTYYDELGCQRSSTQVSGISGPQFLYIDTTGHTVVSITGPVTP